MIHRSSHRARLALGSTALGLTATLTACGILGDTPKLQEEALSSVPAPGEAWTQDTSHIGDQFSASDSLTYGEDGLVEAGGQVAMVYTLRVDGSTREAACSEVFKWTAATLAHLPGETIHDDGGVAVEEATKNCERQVSLGPGNGSTSGSDVFYAAGNSPVDGYAYGVFAQSWTGGRYTYLEVAAVATPTDPSGSGA